MVTILDVAREAQVAPSTVSLVTNNNGYVSPATRQRVEKTIKRLGYKARRPRARLRTLNLAVIYTPSPTATGMSAIALACVEGIQTALGRQQVRPSLIATTPQGQDPIFQQSLHNQQFDGAIVVGASRPGDRYVHLLADEGVPTLVINRVLPSLRASSVTADFRQGGYLATAELASYGHRRIGFVGLDQEHWPSAERYEGHLQALLDFNLSPGDDLLLPMERQIESRDQTAAAYCRRAVASGHTGFAVSNQRAQQWASCLADLGLSVPEDVSLVGFDGPLTLEAQHGRTLASIDYDKCYLGELAVETLKELIAGRDRIGRMVKSINVTYVDGQSVAAPRASADPSARSTQPDKV